MKICSIRIKGFRQFEDTFIDFTNPETGEPVNKVCFIGRNGTGKSTLLDLINSFLVHVSSNQSSDKTGFSRGILFFTIKLKFEEQTYIIFNSTLLKNDIFFSEEIEEVSEWYEKLTIKQNTKSVQEQVESLKAYQLSEKKVKLLLQNIALKDNSEDLLIYSPPESPNSEYLLIHDVPQTNMNQSIELFQKFPFSHTVSEGNFKRFWSILIYLIRKRDDDRETFENREENLNKTKRELIQEFDSKNPEILDKLAKLWNKILDKPGLEFDVKNAKKPIHLHENLHAYITHKETKQRINYYELSTGIRDFIFRIGHICSLYFNRSIKRGFLLIDEPENSLFPDFLFDLVETYEELVIDKNGENNTQMFISTHNPIIAAQFEPYERIILEWDDHGYVKANKGEAPVGDDPNDVLRRDFNLSNLMGREGRKMWEKYLDLRKQLRRTKDESKKEKLIYQINKIGTDYNFGS